MKLEALIDLFPRKTKVTFIHATTGQLIGIHKMATDQLPLAFDKPTTIELDGATWRVMQARPIHAKDFTIDRKLTLHVQEPTSINPNSIGFDYPTICADIPSLVAEPLFDDFFLDIPKNQWRQLEFMPATVLPEIQEEMLQIQTILLPGEGINTLCGYEKIHIRKKIISEPLSISIDEFCSRTNILEKGSIRCAGKRFIANGFAFRSDNYTYYGITNEGNIELLCLQSFECMDEEFYRVVITYDLVLLDWCNGKVIMI